jgi:signal transduction histidine kinase
MASRPERWRGLAVDLGVAVLALAGTLVMLAAGGFGTPEPGTRSLDATGIVLAIVSATPLVARRFMPATAFAVTAAAALELLRLQYPLEVPLGPAISAYALALAYGAHPSGWRRRAAMLAVWLFVPAIAVVYGSVGVDVWSILAPELLGWEAIFIGIWIAGDRARLRREQISHLRERAERSEREADRERRLAAAEERTRIARELHDSAGHAINVILVQAGAARLLQEQDPVASREAIATIETVARETVAEIDRFVRALREDAGPEPPAPTDLRALTELVERHRASGLSVTTDVRDVERPLPQSVAWAAYRILQEALTNAARHGPGRADVVVCAGPAEVDITVINPTTGVPNGHRGHGITGMRERTTLLGGTLDAVAEGGRFRLHARLPYAHR